MLRSRRVAPTRFVAIGVLCGIAIWSCSSSDKEKIQAAGLAEGCTLNSDCGDPLVCTFTRCHDQCKTDRDCPGEQRCIVGGNGYVCQLKVETDCTKKASVCQGDQVCGVDGECRDSCAANEDCTKGQTCAASGECASTITTKDTLDETGNILPDPFVDPADGAGGASGNAGASGRGGVGATAGASSTGAGGDAGGANASVGGAATGAAGSAAIGGATVTGGTTSGAGAPSAPGTAGKTGTTGTAGAAGAEPLGCAVGRGDCDSNPNDCETDLALITSCGKCNVSCDGSHGAVKCDAATLKCVINTVAGGCNTGYADCNTDGIDGCEASLATDATNCGVCGRSCGGGKCTSSQCGAAIVFDPTGVTTLSYSYTGDVAMVGTQIIKLNTSNGTEIRTSTLPPTDPVSQGSVLVNSTTAIYAMDVDTTNVYNSIAGSPASIIYKPLAGTASTAAKTAVNMPDSNYARVITNNSTAFYIVAYASSGYQILTAAKTLTVATAATPLSGLTARADIASMVVAGSNVFWVESPNTVYASPLSGGTPVVIDSTIQSGYYSYVRLATDGTYVYWNTYNGASSKIRRVLASGSPTSTAVEDVAIGVNSPSTGLAIDSSFVYFYSSYQVYRVAKDGSASVESLANLNSSPYFYNLFAADTDFVYGTGYYGQVVRVAKGAVSP